VPAASVLIACVTRAARDLLHVDSG
jgi:hypothetical protein